MIKQTNTHKQFNLNKNLNNIMQNWTLYKLSSCKIIIQKQKEYELKVKRNEKIDRSSMGTSEKSSPSGRGV